MPKSPLCRPLTSQTAIPPVRRGSESEYPLPLYIFQIFQYYSCYHSSAPCSLMSHHAPRSRLSAPFTCRKAQFYTTMKSALRHCLHQEAQATKSDALLSFQQTSPVCRAQVTVVTGSTICSTNTTTVCPPTHPTTHPSPQVCVPWLRGL